MRSALLASLVLLGGCGAGSPSGPESSAPASVASAASLVRMGMSVEEVESALGGPGIPDSANPDVLRYPAGTGKLRISFQEGKVMEITEESGR